MCVFMTEMRAFRGALTSWPQFEPWHMITSFIQYLLMAPSYISVLNVYAVRSASGLLLRRVMLMNFPAFRLPQFANVQCVRSLPCA